MRAERRKGKEKDVVLLGMVECRGSAQEVLLQGGWCALIGVTAVWGSNVCLNYSLNGTSDYTPMWVLH